MSLHEITRESLHKSLKEKPKEIQNRFLEVANLNIRKGLNYSLSIAEANKAVEELEIKLQDENKLQEEQQVQLNKAKIVETFKAVKPLQVYQPPVIDTPEDIDPEQIKSIYFDNNGRLVIEFEDGYKIVSGNSIPESYIEQHVSVNVNPVFDYIRFNPDILLNSTLPHEEGLVFYDKFSHSLCYYNDHEGITVNIGQEQLLPVYNMSGVDIPDGSVVYVNGAYLKHSTVALASCTSKEQAYGVIGVATIPIENGTHGYVCIAGAVNGLDTSAYTAGQVLYLSETPGQFTTIPPLQPNYIVEVAQVTNVGTTDGSLNVRIDRRDWFPSLQLLSPEASIELPTTPTVFKPSTVVYNDGFLYDALTGEITFLESSDYTFTIQFNAYPSASNKNIYFYVEEFDGTNWVIGRYTARQIRLVNQVEDQVQVTAARYFKVGSKLRFNIWGDSTVQLRSTDLPGTTPGTVTLPAFRLNVA